jgi:hypothetical protein
MTEQPYNETATRRVVMAGTLVVSIAAVVVLFRGDRAYQRWLTEISPFARPRAGIKRYRSDFQRRRSSAAELGRLINDVLDMVAEAARASM